MSEVHIRKMILLLSGIHIIHFFSDPVSICLPGQKVQVSFLRSRGSWLILSEVKSRVQPSTNTMIWAIVLSILEVLLRISKNSLPSDVAICEVRLDDFTGWLGCILFGCKKMPQSVSFPFLVKGSGLELLSFFFSPKAEKHISSPSQKRDISMGSFTLFFFERARKCRSSKS